MNEKEPVKKITAAPDLLEALKVALTRLETAAREQRYNHNIFDDVANDEAIDVAIAAINKATGELS